jgi:hypothetical protein
MSRRNGSRFGPGFIAALVFLVAFFCICLVGLFQEFGGSNWGTTIIIVAVVIAGLIGLGNVFYGRNSPYVKAHARTASPPRMPPPSPPAPPPPSAPPAPPSDPLAPESQADHP